MGFWDKLTGKAKQTVDQHGDKVGEGMDKAAGFAKEKTGGKYDDQIDQGEQKAEDALDNLDGKNDDIA
ncbi:MAG: antitoxin [Nocardioidaceae bacterium]